MSNAEDQITAWFERQSRLPAEFFPIGIGDDMAQIQLTPDGAVLITTDMLLDGVHFDLKSAGLKQAGYKAMAVSLSDCAAMATIPVAAVVSVALPSGFGGEALKELHAGISVAGEKYGCYLVGGDITSWKNEGPFAISVAMLSRPASNKPIRRCGAKPGDCICVTGSLGGSGLGRHLTFEPRVREAIKLAGLITITAMIDVSDGLSSDLNRICRQSKVGGVVNAELIPISNEAGVAADPLNSALNDGEDFELLFTLSAEDYSKLSADWDEPLVITKIGTINDSGQVQLKRVDGQIGELTAKGYDHLGSD